MKNIGILVIFAIIIIDGFVIGALAIGICSAAFGDSPVARLIRLLVSFLFGIGYIVLCCCVPMFSDRVSVFIECVIFLGPIALAIIFGVVGKVLEYMYKDSDE